AALDGAVLALNKEKRGEVERMADEAKYLSLSGSAHFQRDFMKYMDF
ncbi:MAG: ATP-binding protein, partial [Deltaproteobacteria bacterium]|nr:ATP-binding protein [Deltaproteobacteria bacterium]